MELAILDSFKPVSKTPIPEDQDVLFTCPGKTRNRQPMSDAERVLDAFKCSFSKSRLDRCYTCLLFLANQSMKMFATLPTCSTMITPTTPRITSIVSVVLVVLAKWVPPLLCSQLTVSALKSCPYSVFTNSSQTPSRPVISSLSSERLSRLSIPVLRRCLDMAEVVVVDVTEEVVAAVVVATAVDVVVVAVVSQICTLCPSFHR